MGNKKYLRTNMAPMIDKYIHFMRDEMGRNFKIEKTILYAYDNYCFDKSWDDYLTQEHFLEYCLDGVVIMVQRAKRYRALFHFYDFCRIYDESLPPIAMQPIEAKHHRYLPYIYTKKDINELMLAAKNMKHWSEAMIVRWQCLIGIYYCTGLRECELRNLKIQDIDFEQQLFVINVSKFRKSRIVPVHKSVLNALKVYLPMRTHQDSDVVFQTFSGNPLSASTFSQSFNKVIEEHKIGYKDGKKPRIHDFRHSFAVNKVVEWQKSGKNVQELLSILSTYLGHSHYEDTAYYLESSENILKSAMAKFETLGGRKK